MFVQFGLCTGHNSIDVLIVGSTFRINIPSKNPLAGVDEAGPKGNG
jgi:hypothetical protein